MKPDSKAAEIEALRLELAYMRRLTVEGNARLLVTDAKSIAIRNELEQKRRGFRLMAELAVGMNQDSDSNAVFASVARSLNATLNMSRTAVLLPDGPGAFKAAVLQGYPTEEREEIEKRRIPVDRELLDPLHPVIVTGADPVIRLGAFREALRLPYFIAAPVFLNNEAVALQVAGRLYEQRPYMPRLGKSDVETIQTVSAYISAILTSSRLRQAETLAKHDPLTQLPNLRGSTEKLHHILAMARRGGFFTAVMFIDLDGFKSVNDTHGHAVGDLVLKGASERISACIRESDFAGRIGGDEFLVALSHIHQPRDAGLVAQKIIARLEQPFSFCDSACLVGASIGIALFPDHGSDEAALIRAADEAMYSIKRHGKNSYAFAKQR